MYVNLYYLVWNIILDNIFVLIPKCIVLDEQWREGKPYIFNLLTLLNMFGNGLSTLMWRNRYIQIGITVFVMTMSYCIC